MAIRVLLVGGDPDVRTSLARGMSNHGYTVDEAVDARSALSVLRFARPSVVLYFAGPGASRHALRDLVEACAGAEESGPPMIVVSAGRPPREATAALRPPVELSDLLEAVNQVLGRKVA